MQSISVTPNPTATLSTTSAPTPSNPPTLTTKMHEAQALAAELRNAAETLTRAVDAFLSAL